MRICHPNPISGNEDLVSHPRLWECSEKEGVGTTAETQLGRREGGLDNSESFRTPGWGSEVLEGPWRAHAEEDQKE